jgi:uncharacterized protein YkwD
MKRFFILVMVSTAIVAAAGFALADIIKLNTGGRIIGKIVEEDESQVVVETPTGRTVVMREDIASIEPGETLQDIYKKHLNEMDANSAKDHHKLGLWCKENKMAEEYEKHMLRAIKLDPEYAPPHEELGYIFYRGKWMEYEDACKAKGWKKHEGKWYPAKDVECMEQGLVRVAGKWVSKEALEKERKARLSKIRKYERAAASTKIEEIKVPDELQQLLEMARDPEAAKRLAAYDALHAKDKLARDLLAKLLFQERAKSRKKVVGYFKNNKGSIRKKLAKYVEDRRRKARAIIFDKTIYPDANHGRSGQAKVDEAVNALRLVYETPFEFYLQKNSTVQERWEEYKKTIELVNKYTDARIRLDEEKKEISREVSDAVAMWKVMAPRGSAETLEYNKRIKTTLTKEERACIDTTNQYRMMLGRRPLRVHEGLVQAARKHSQCMKDNNFFSHGCKIHGGPATRCRKEGAPYSGENISTGPKMGAGAFRSWYGSSGHHRNMLANHRFIGVGNAGRLWTMDLG